MRAALTLSLSRHHCYLIIMAASSIVQVNSWGAPSQREQKKRTIVKPACVGSILLVMYLGFMYLILNTFEDNTGQDSGAVSHLAKSFTRGTRSSSGKSGSVGKRDLDQQPGKSSSEKNASISMGKGDLVQQPEKSSSVLAGEENMDHQPISEAKEIEQKQSNQVSSSSVEKQQHPDLIHFCGDCFWKDTLVTCDKRVAWELTEKHIPEIESKQNNLVYCIKPDETHVAAFCGGCQFKDTDTTCQERLKFEMKQHGINKLAAMKKNLQFCKNPPYVLSPVCGGCARALTNVTSKAFRDGTPCSEMMLRRINHGKAASLAEAARLTVEEYPECQRCQPKTCWKTYFNDLAMNVKGLDKMDKGFLTKYWRFDLAAPKIEAPTTLALPSIPKEVRIPPSRFKDIEAFLTEKYNEFESNNDTKHVPIFIEYNPGIAPIPRKMKKLLPKYAEYVVAFRVTPANNCFRRDQMQDLPQKVWDHTMMSPTNMLGLALLDEEYGILPGYDIVVDIANQLGFVKDGYGTTYFGEPTFMDYRLFTLNDKVYLHANADITVVTPIELRSKRHSRKAEEGEFKLDIVYGDPRMEVFMLHQFNTIWSGGDRGKNFALFSVPNSTHPDEPDATYAEIDINPHHRVIQVHLDDVEMLKRKIVKKRIRRNYTVDPIMMRKVREEGNLTTSNMEPEPSFYTVDEHWYPGVRPAFRRAGHGGSCCVSLSRKEVLAQGEHISLTHENWGNNDNLLVGVAHTSVIWRKWYSDKNVPDSEKAMIPHTHYVSFFYAFEPRPPFNILARSGYFCLGFAGDDGTEGGNFNPHSILTFNRRLSQHNETFSCPQISFVSSFIEKVEDPSTTIIGYGLNDCTPRLVEVSKKEISRMVFSDPWEMKIEKETTSFDRDMADALEMSKPIAI